MPIIFVAGLVFWQFQSPAQPAGPILEASDVLCAIQYRYASSANGLRGTILCDSQQSSGGADFFFISRHWRTDLVGETECDCDLDFDGLTACEEVAVCGNPADNDADNDCLGDGLEVLLGLNPSMSDTDGNGTDDGDEDLDQDGIPEKDEDFDADALYNCQEVMAGTDPTSPDTDGDGFPDGAEVDAQTLALLSNPQDDSSEPEIPSVSAPPTLTVLPKSDFAAGEFQFSTAVSSPPATVVAPSSNPDAVGLEFNLSVSFPPATVVIPSSQSAGTGGLNLNTSVAFPPTQVEYQ
ncbi:MAG: hypothetical protein HUU16_12190 [Candidatus Omnitrophica bacterium]|nr:hypothetical protein [Candidatus Omnitrophota bacterium]